MRWSDISNIAEALEDTHSDEEEIEEIQLSTIQEWVGELLDFDDDPNIATNTMLEAIQSEWLELRGDH